MMERLAARLDKKTGSKVLCGRINCRGYFGDVDVPYRDCFFFTRGWGQRKDGVWELRKHAKATLVRRDDGRSVYVPGRSLSLFPALAACPICGFVQVLDAEKLGIYVDPD